MLVIMNVSGISGAIWYKIYLHGSISHQSTALDLKAGGRDPIGVARSLTLRLQPILSWE